MTRAVAIVSFLSLVALGCGVLSGSARAAEEAREAPSPELKEVLDALDAANKKVDVVEADIVYLREIPLLEEKQESKGSLAFKKPGHIHLTLGKPRNEEVFTNGKQWWVVSHNDKQVEIYRAAEGDEMTEASFLTFGYGQSAEKLLENYEITLKDKKTEEEDGKKITRYRLSFVPRDEDAPARFARIEVEVADDLFLPNMIVLHESDGEIVHTFNLNDIDLEADAEEDDFSYEAPKGYSVIRP